MKKIRIGNQTSFSAPTPVLPFEYAIENGFDAFEWFPDRHGTAGWDTRCMDAGVRRYIRDRAAAHDIALSVHASLQGNPLEARTHGTILQDIDFARDIGAGIVNIHLYADKGPDDYVAALMPFARLAAEAGISLSIENTPLTVPGDFNRVFSGLRETGEAAHVGMCLDLGHANLCGPTRNDYLRFIDLLDPRIPVIHIHMHENFGDSDSHLPLFTGPAGKDTRGLSEFIRRMKRRGFSGSVILEQWPQPPLLLNEARDRLYYMWNEKGAY